MTVDPTVLTVIVGMAAITAIARAIGFWLFARVAPSPRFEVALKSMTPAILIAVIVPEVAHGGLAAWLAGIATVIAAIVSRQLLSALIVGVVAVALLRVVIP